MTVFTMFGLVACGSGEDRPARLTFDDDTLSDNEARTEGDNLDEVQDRIEQTSDADAE